MNTPEAVAAQYSTSANLDARIQLHERFGLEPQPWSQWLLAQFDLPAQAQILEVGCGTGKLWQATLDRLPSGWSITLTDQSAGMLAQTRANLGDKDKRFAFEQMDVQTLTFPDATFDAVVANHMLYHVPDLAKGLMEIERVLKPGGKLFAATNGAEHLIEMHELVHQFDANFAIKPWRLGFSLENGAELLAPYFHEVKLLRFHSSLRVTEAEPLVAYVRSMDMINPAQMGEFREFVQATLHEHAGVIAIQRAAGLFCAVK